jgi:hypothetical protein
VRDQVTLIQKKMGKIIVLYVSDRKQIPNGKYPPPPQFNLLLIFS